MSSPDRHRVCPRCGADAQGAAWCPQCGRNLRITPAAEEPPRAEPPPAEPPRAEPPPREQPPREQPPPPIEPHTGRNAALALLGVLLVAGLVVLAVNLNHRHHDTTITDSGLVTGTGITDTGITGTGTTDTGTTDTGTTTPSEPAANVSTTVTAQDMARLIGAYVTGYNNQDTDAMSAVLTDDVVLDDVNGTTQGLQQVLQVYQVQFNQLGNPTLQLSGMQSGQGFATGNYTLSADAGSESGSVDFDFTTAGGQPAIDHITLTPS
jgi:ketosteroid isomerase-like protein